MTERIVIFGGTGFLGGRLAEKLKNEYEITIASRNDNVENKTEGVTYRKFSYTTASFSELIDSADIVVNFSGASIAGRRWNEEYKKIMYDSRVKTTKMISDAIISASKKPHSFISTSATGIYGNRQDEVLTEESKTGSDYLANMCVDWENAAFKSNESAGVRTVCVRVGVVLDKNEGGFARMIQPFRFFVGGRLGSGKQYLPWVHVEDIINIYIEAIKNKSLAFAVNGTAPEPVTNSIFSSAVAKALKRPNLFMVPGFALKIILGEFAEFLTGSQRAVPEKLGKLNFNFKYKDIGKALENLLG